MSSWFEVSIVITLRFVEDEQTFLTLSYTKNKEDFTLHKDLITMF